MNSKGIISITNIFERNFLINALIPCFIFWTLIIIITILGCEQNPLRLIEVWDRQNGFLKIFQIIASVTFITLSANILFSQSGNIIRFYEGYWGFPGRVRASQTLLTKGL